MANKWDARRRKRQLTTMAIAVIVIASIGIYFAFFNSPPPPAMDFRVGLSIQLENNNGTQIRYIVPPSIGEPGGLWKSSTFNGYGVGSNYPLYTDPPVQNYSGFTIIHVKSSVVRNYTLGDFFAVWGYPIGPNMTLTLTSHSPGGAYWTMCVGASQSSLTAGNWGKEVLTIDKQIILKYGATPCMGNS